jgi:hypothetical protein
MKQKTKLTLTVIAIAILIGIIACMISFPKTSERIVEVQKEVAVPYPVEVFPQREPEFRKPPLKQYKPGLVQQMGMLLGEDGESLPLYGKEVHGRRDRYHYYTSTTGEQVYSLPVTHDTRDCMDDLGCQELYGNESVSVLGKSQPYQASLYRTTNYF